MRSPTRLLLTCLALLALGWAQTFGLNRGYVCDCGGVVQVTVSDHCHGPHSEACHDHESAEAEACHEHPDLPADDDTHHHAPLKEDVVAKQLTSSMPLIAAPVAWATAWDLPPVFLPAAKDSRMTILPGQELGDPGGRARRWPEMLAHAIALQV